MGEVHGPVQTKFGYHLISESGGIRTTRVLILFERRFKVVVSGGCELALWGARGLSRLESHISAEIEKRVMADFDFRAKEGQLPKADVWEDSKKD